MTSAPAILYQNAVTGTQAVLPKLKLMLEQHASPCMIRNSFSSKSWSSLVEGILSAQVVSCCVYKMPKH